MKFTTIKQLGDELLADYRKRYQEAEAQREASGWEPWPPADVAFHFVAALYDDRAREQFSNLHCTSLEGAAMADRSQ